MKKYFSMAKTGREATIHIFGDITSYEYLESDVSSYSLVKALSELTDVDTIHVRINSYGGEVAEGLAIYNALKMHKAKIVTYCDGFACSIASVIFIAGNERNMSNASLLMIHNAWTWCSGNAKELRKTADDLETITEASINAYMTVCTVEREELVAMLDGETWLNSEKALELGFSTATVKEDSPQASQSVKRGLINMILTHQENTEDEEPESEDDPEDDTEEDAEDAAEEDKDSPDDAEEEDEEENGTKETADEPAQCWQGFFSALNKMEG